MYQDDTATKSNAISQMVHMPRVHMPRYAVLDLPKRHNYVLLPLAAIVRRHLAAKLTDGVEERTKTISTHQCPVQSNETLACAREQVFENLPNIIILNGINGSIDSIQCRHMLFKKRHHSIARLSKKHVSRQSALGSPLRDEKRPVSQAKHQNAM